jgi:hypothetical protein
LQVTKKARRDNSNRFDSIYQFERCTQSARSTKRAQFFDNVCKSLRTVEIPPVQDWGDFDAVAIKQLWAAYLDTLERCRSRPVTLISHSHSPPHTSCKVH